MTRELDPLFTDQLFVAVPLIGEALCAVGAFGGLRLPPFGLSPDPVRAGHRQARTDIAAAEAGHDAALRQAQQARRSAQEANERATSAETAADEARTELQGAEPERDQVRGERDELASAVTELPEKLDTAQRQVITVHVEAEPTNRRLQDTAGELAQGPGPDRAVPRAADYSTVGGR